MIATAVSAGIGLVYPWNAKFGYLTDGKLPTKYPMVSAWLLLPGALWAAKKKRRNAEADTPAQSLPQHYVPEVLMTVLTGAGLYCLFTSKK